MQATTKLKALLRAYETKDVQELTDKTFMLDFLTRYPNALSRENQLGHFTASAWVVNPNQSKVLMVYHRIYAAWTWPGGHADGDSDLLETAIRETREETGLSQVRSLSPLPCSLETIAVQAHEKQGSYVPPHLHFNLTFLLEAEENQPLLAKEDENQAVAWREIPEILSDHTEPHMLTLYRKIIHRLGQFPGNQ